MALISFHGFDELVSSSPGNDLQNAFDWANQTGWYGNACAQVAGQLGGSAVNVNALGPYVEYTNSPNNLTTAIVGMRWQMHAVGTGSIAIMHWYDSNVASQCGIGFNASTNKLFFFRGTTATVVATSTATLSVGTWYYLEFQVTISTTVGAFQVNINGVADSGLTATNQNTQATGIASVLLFRSESGASFASYIDDVYVSDTTGAAPYNTFLGTATTQPRVETLYPNGNDSVSFTPLANTNWQEVSATQNNAGSTYNSSSASNVDLFTHGALSSNPTTIWAVKPNISMETTDQLNIPSRTKLVSGATTQNGASKTPHALYLYFNDIYLTDPNTGVAWTGPALNRCAVGYERI